MSRKTVTTPPRLPVVRYPVVNPKRGFAGIGLHNPKNSVNVGGAMRAAGVYGASLVALDGPRSGSLMRGPTDTMKSWRHVPVLRNDDLFDAVPFDCVPVAVDYSASARALPDYIHPERAFYIFGAEDATLGRLTLSRCRDTIYIPTRRCMNLAATVNVVLYDRCMKRGEWPSQERANELNPYVKTEWRPGVTKATNKDGDELVLMGECGIGGQRED